MLKFFIQFFIVLVFSMIYIKSIEVLYLLTQITGINEGFSFIIFAVHICVSTFLLVYLMDYIHYNLKAFYKNDSKSYKHRIHLSFGRRKVFIVFVPRKGKLIRYINFITFKVS